LSPGDEEDPGAALQVNPREFRSNESHVVALGAIAGERNGEKIDSEVVWALKLRDGKVVWARVYQELGPALEDAGIS
jgi:ketosteroid isomerase-like protein